MRLQGKITDWRDDRGFGFITPNGGGKTVFLHVSAFRRGAGRPMKDDIVTYVTVDGPKGPKADDVAIVRVGYLPTSERRKGRWSSVFGTVIALVIIGLLGNMVFNMYKRTYLAAQPPLPLESPAPSKLFGVTDPSQFKCDGRTRCSQMTSCEEAKFFINNCTGTAMDGDNDGVPCERELCK